jgi:hypothetical protein
VKPFAAKNCEGLIAGHREILLRIANHPAHVGALLQQHDAEPALASSRAAVAPPPLPTSTPRRDGGESRRALKQTVVRYVRWMEGVNFLVHQNGT